MHPRLALRTLCITALALSTLLVTAAPATACTVEVWHVEAGTPVATVAASNCSPVPDASGGGATGTTVRLGGHGALDADADLP